MAAYVLLDSGPLGLLSHPAQSETTKRALGWAEAQMVAGCTLIVPEIADYEVRRELTRAGRFRGINRLNDLATAFAYLPLTTAMMRRAANLWAEARNSGRPSASKDSLDGDVILAAQALVYADEVGLDDVVVATTNPRHLEHYVSAKNWHEIN